MKASETFGDFFFLLPISVLKLDNPLAILPTLPLSPYSAPTPSQPALTLPFLVGSPRKQTMPSRGKQNKYTSPDKKLIKLCKKETKKEKLTNLNQLAPEPPGGAFLLPVA